MACLMAFESNVHGFARRDNREFFSGWFQRIRGRIDSMNGSAYVNASLAISCFEIPNFAAMASTLDQSTIVASATASGVGAIAVIRLSGPDAIAICNGVFRGKNLEEVASHTIHFGTIRDGETILDEVLVSVFKGPNSYTGENTIELSCHGSPFIQQQIINLVIAKGARAANPGEFTLRAFIHGKLDLSQAEAVADLIASESEAAHRLAMHQMRGGFSAEIKKLREELIHFASLIELELDFSEEDVEFANRDDLKALLLKVHKVCQQLIDSFQTGNVLKNGVPVAIVGKPNAGKSTLLNALLNEERAIVSEIAGTTRDTIEDVMSISGIQFRFIDTAGLRDTEDTIEAIGVRKSHEKMQEAAIVLYLYDVSTETPEEVELDIQQLEEQLENAQLIVVANKSDLAPGNPSSHESAPSDSNSKNTIQISAKTGEGITQLTDALLQTVNSGTVGQQDTVITNARHLEALTEANDALLRAYTGLNTGITGDFIAMDIRQSLHYLGEITGEITTDDLLGNIFSKFCIGK